MTAVEVITSVERRRRWSRDEKLRIVAESSRPSTPGRRIASRSGSRRTVDRAQSRTFGGRAKTRYLSTSSCAGNRAAVRPPLVFAIFGTVSLSRVLTNSVSFSEKRIGSPLCSAKNCGSNTLNQMPWR